MIEEHVVEQTNIQLGEHEDSHKDIGWGEVTGIRKLIVA